MPSGSLSLLALAASLAAPPAQTVWVLGYDRSASVPKEQFAEYPAIARTAVLELLRPGETVVILGVEGPEAIPQTVLLSRRLSEFQRQVCDIDRRLQGAKQARGPHRSDLALLLDHLRHRIRQDDTLGVLATTRYLAVGLTDGVPDGPQSGGDAGGPPITADARILFLGVRRGTEEGLSRMAARAGFGDCPRLVLPFPFWRQQVPNLPSFLQRSVNPAARRALTRTGPPPAETR